ncbi:YqaJ viral recombinase family protein [Streptomyces sp. NPDC087851]|uniref:YqaJ viral recombinase family nuclease n=1 Tax=Streptomyces sp. NPDC087851 TaxID=3365810 RepID=UPI0037FDA778
MTTRPESKPPARGGDARVPGAKAEEELCSIAPETLPAPGEFPTARLVLPADAPEEQWHAVRRSGIGGSDVAAVLGMNRYGGPLHVWEEKHGRGDYVDSEAAECGRELEDTIARIFGRRAGLPIEPAPGTLQHIERPWMLANLDRIAVEADGARAPVECKNRSEHQARQWDDEVPDAPALQLHWYLAVTGYTHGYVAALIGGNRVRWFRLERDQELIDHLVTYCGAWWQRHIVDGVPPAPDGSAATTELLAHLWDVGQDATTEVDPVETMILKTRRRELWDRIAADEYELSEVENQMRARLGAAEVALIGGRPAYTWRQNGNFAPARFRKEQPELAAEYTHQVSAIDTERLAADHPKIYSTYRARVLRVPSEG